MLWVYRLHHQQIAEGLQIGAHLLEVDHLTVHLHQRQGQVGGLAGLLDHHIVELLRVAELGEHHQNALGVSRLGGVHDPLHPVLVLIVQHGAVAHGGELLRQRVEGVGPLRRVGAVLAGLGGHVVGHDVQAHLVDDGVQRRGVRQDAGDDDGQLLRGGSGGQLGDEGLHQLGVLLLGHEEGALEDVAALGGGDLRVLGQHLVQLAHGGVVAVIDLDGGQQLLLGERAAQLFKVADDPLIAGLGIGDAVGGLAVLGIGHGDERDGRHGVLPVLAHGLEGVAQGGDNDGAGAFVGTGDAQLQQGLDDGA